MLQNSTKRNKSLKVNNGQTTAKETSINFHYTREDYDNAIRAYVGSVLSKLSFYLVKQAKNWYYRNTIGYGKDLYTTGIG